ncbi:MAG: acetyltransferase [Gammaproteobacteria bacterium]|nr:acetyltransferase [Gammaproteobacteria bacterium]MDX2461914.1 acetyltransferase [Gammaproteobacteria bacterium]
MKRLVIVGAGGTGEDAAEIIRAVNQRQPTYEMVGFLDDDPSKKSQIISGLPVHGPLGSAPDHVDTWFVDCLGSPSSFRARQALIDGLGVAEDRFETLVHPAAEIAESSSIGAGSIVYPFVYVGAGAAVGRHVIILSQVTVNHHCRVGDYSILTTGCAVSGHVTLGRCVYLGAGCTLRDGIEIGDETLVGMGSVVTRSVAAGQVVKGVPAAS